MSKPYLALAHFHPSLFRTTRSARESYAHDDGVTYLVAQPFLFTQGHADQIDPEAYFTSWTAERLTTSGIGFIGEAEGRGLQAGTITAVPVPFPPGTRLSLELHGALRSGTPFGPWSDPRLIGGTTAKEPVDDAYQLPGDGSKGWPAFAVLSRAEPLIDTYADLIAQPDSGSEREEVLKAVLALFAEMVILWQDADSTSLPSDARGAIWTEIVKPNHRDHRLEDIGWWRRYLDDTERGKSRIARVYDDLVRRQTETGRTLGDDRPAARMPRYLWKPHALRSRGDLFLEGLAGRSYLHALWTTLGRMAGDPMRKDELPDLLGRLFGFGERLAWPTARLDHGVAGSRRFMTLRPNLLGAVNPPGWIKPEDWCVTNVLSLAGQVFRIGPFDHTDPPVLTSATLEVCGHVPVQSAALAEKINVFFEAIAQAAGAPLMSVSMRLGSERGSQKAPPAEPERLVLFAAREAKLERLAEHAVPSGGGERFIYALPEGLLDLVDATPRITEDAPGRLPHANLVRRALLRTEVHNPDTLLRERTAWLRRSVSLSERPLGLPERGNDPPKGRAYVLTLQEKVHTAEAIVETWLASLAQGTPLREASLWIPQVDDGGNPVSAVEFTLLAGTVTRDHDGAILVLVPDHEASGSLTEVLQRTPAFPGADRGAIRHSAVVDLVFKITDPLDPFDLIEAPKGGQVPVLTLARAPASRLTRSADRLSHSLAVTWQPPFDPDGKRPDERPTPLEDQAADTNKLRLSLETTGYTRDMSNPDALLPLPPKPFQGESDRPWTRCGPVYPNGPQAWYWLSQHFDQDMGSVDKREETRFVAWTRAGQPFSINGYVEHQYGHRIDIEPLPVDLRRSVEIAHPAMVSATKPAPLAQAASREERYPLLTVEEIGPDGNRTILVSFRRDPLRIALDQYAARLKADPDSRDPAATLRAIYRSLADLRDAMMRGTAELRIEPWAFDNTKAIADLQPGQVATVEAALKPLPAVTRALPPPAAGTELAEVFAALGQSFEAFVKALQAVANGDPARPWHEFLNDRSDVLTANASLLRVGLKLVRPDDVTADSAWKDGPFVPVAEDGSAGAAQTLAEVAKDELTEFLTDPASRLRASFAWVEPGEAGQKADGRAVGLGAPRLIVPHGGVEPVDRVANLFYMPHAFLVPAAHPALGDRQGTFAFAGFLLQLVEDLLAGRSVKDRLELAEMSPADAARMRRELRTLIGHGVADRLMNLFMRVDIPESDPLGSGKDARHVLHWHAGRVLDALENLPEHQRPSTAVRSMLIERPSLYATARAIAIAPFNTRTDPSPHDPAAAVNQSTFSPQLARMTLTKRLIADDDTETEDTDSFDLTALRGGEESGTLRCYVLDVLPDRQYDDTILIHSSRYTGVDPLDGTLLGLPRSRSDVCTRGDAFALRGEDVIDPENQSAGRSPQTPRALEIDVVHVVPSWRVVRKGEPYPFEYYLLPERLPPPVPRVVEAFKTSDHKKAARSSIVVNVPGPPLGGGLPTVDLDDQWSARYEDAIRDLDAVEVGGTDRQMPPKSYRRIRPASIATGSAAHRPILRANQAEGWHLLTTELAHFWFELQLQKENRKVVENLDDDTYEIEVEMWPCSPPAEEPEEPMPIAAEKADPLLAAFRLQRTRNSGADQPKLPALDSRGLPNAIRRWLDSPPAQEPWLGCTLLERPPSLAGKAVDPRCLRRRFRIDRDPNGPWRIREILEPGQPASPDAVGAVVGFEVLARTADGAANGPRYDDPVPLANASVLLRVSVLDHPFHISRARLRILRNWKNVDGDDVPDIHPDFLLTERYSHWATEGRVPQVADEGLFEQFKVPPIGREIRVVPQGANAKAAIDAWLSAIDQGGSINYGPALPAALAQPVCRDVRRGPVALWERNWMEEARFSVGAVFSRIVEDATVRYGAGGTVATIATRTLSSVRQIVPPIRADQLDKLLADLRPEQIITLDPLVELMWRDADGAVVLTARLLVRHLER